MNFIPPTLRILKYSIQYVKKAKHKKISSWKVHIVEASRVDLEHCLTIFRCRQSCTNAQIISWGAWLPVPLFCAALTVSLNEMSYLNDKFSEITMWTGFNKNAQFLRISRDAKHSCLTFSTWHNLVIHLKWQKKQNSKNNKKSTTVISLSSIYKIYKSKSQIL